MTTDPEVKRLQAVYRDYHRQSCYQHKWSEANPGNRAMARERHRLLTRLLQVHGFFPLAGRRILDVGCGGGGTLASFKSLGAPSANLYGIDLRADRITLAKESFPDIQFQVGNAEHLVFQSGYFDLVLLYTVFSSILDINMARNVSREIRRVLKPGGAVVWYDFIYNNPRNPHVRGLKRPAISALFPEFRLGLHKITLFPPLARRLGPLTSVLYPALAAIPCLRTHYLGLLQKPEG
jgi:2-polyprenyl-3-methyl-5-hydroxy-6-metoxy-1,4-benzoquinol methylase